MNFIPKALDTSKVLEGIEAMRQNKKEVIERDIAAKRAYLNGYEDAINEIDHICRYRNWEHSEPTAQEQDTRE